MIQKAIMLTEVIGLCVILLSQVALLDTFLYGALPNDKLTLTSLDNVQKLCDGDTNFNISNIMHSGTVLGCVYRTTKTGFVGVPAFSVVMHEEMHVLGYGETEAFAVQAFIFMLYVAPIFVFLYIDM